MNNKVEFSILPAWRRYVEGEIPIDSCNNGADR